MSHVSQVAHEPAGTQRGQPDDAGLIAESCRAPERFGAVFDRHAAAIHGYIARRLGRDAADDLVAETFLVAFRQRGGKLLIRGTAQPSPSRSSADSAASAQRAGSSSCSRWLVPGIAR